MLCESLLELEANGSLVLLYESLEEHSVELAVLIEVICLVGLHVIQS